MVCVGITGFHLTLYNLPFHNIHLLNLFINFLGLHLRLLFGESSNTKTFDVFDGLNDFDFGSYLVPLV